MQGPACGSHSRRPGHPKQACLNGSGPCIMINFGKPVVVYHDDVLSRYANCIDGANQTKEGYRGTLLTRKVSWVGSVSYARTFDLSGQTCNKLKFFSAVWSMLINRVDLDSAPCTTTDSQNLSGGTTTRNSSRYAHTIYLYV